MIERIIELSARAHARAFAGADKPGRIGIADRASGTGRRDARRPASDAGRAVGRA